MGVLSSNRQSIAFFATMFTCGGWDSSTCLASLWDLKTFPSAIQHNICVYQGGYYREKLNMVYKFCEMYATICLRETLRCLKPNRLIYRGQLDGTWAGSRKDEWWCWMKKLAILSIVLLFAGIGLAFGEAGHCTGNCNCPSGTTCSQSVCGTSCGGSCVQEASVTPSASVASSCGTHCPLGGCGGTGGCQACCGANCAACCGAAAS